MSDAVRPHRQQPTRLRHLWDSPGKNTGVGCHFLLQCMKVKSESEAAQSCLTLSDLMDCSLPGSSIHWIFHARVQIQCNPYQATNGIFHRARTNNFINTVVIIIIFFFTMPTVGDTEEPPDLLEKVQGQVRQE